MRRPADTPWLSHPGVASDPCSGSAVDGQLWHRARAGRRCVHWPLSWPKESKPRCAGTLGDSQRVKRPMTTRGSH
jgi:hypothetical protein